MRRFKPATSQDLKLRDLWIELRDDELGASMVEYAVLLAIISLALVGAIQALSEQITAVLETASSGLGSAK
jgi:Flp pilus assembly pilin Flp